MGKTTYQTGVAVANCLIGSAIIIFPLNYLNYGIIQNIICLIIMGFILGTTCSIYGMHLRPSETQITQTIKRLLGLKFFKTAALLSGVVITFVSALFFLLACDICYDIFIEIFGELSLSEKSFKLILMFGFGLLTFLKNLKLVFKASPIAMASLILSTAVMIISLPFNLSNIDKGAIELKEFSIDGMLLVASINGFAFTCHAQISPVIRQNNNRKNNPKSIFIGYTITSIIYLIIGVCGSLAIYGKHPQKNSNVMNYFTGNWQALTIGILNFLYFLMIFPIFPFVAKQQFTGLVPKEKKAVPNFQMKVRISYTLTWLAVNAFFVLTDSSPKKIMGFLGSVASFYFTYLLPVMMMVRAGKVIYLATPQQGSKQPKQDMTKSLLSNNSEQHSESKATTQGNNSETLVTNDETPQNQPLDKSQSQYQTYDNQIVHEKGYIIKHQPLKLKDKILYGIVILVGMILFVSSIIDSIRSI